MGMCNSHFSAEVREKMSESHKGKHHNKETRRKIKESNKRYFQEHPEVRSGINNSFYGEKHSQQTIEKIRNSDYHKNLRGKDNPNYGNHTLKGHKMTDDQCMKISKTKKGNKNPAWIDGRSYFPYPSEFNERLRNKIRERDNNVCQNCLITKKEHIKIYKRTLEVHHIDYNSQNCKEDNLITLCKLCNLKANYDREYWSNFFKKKLIVKWKRN